MDLMRSGRRGDFMVGDEDAAAVLNGLLLVIEAIQEPCATARGLRWGLVRSGLLKAVGLSPVVGLSPYFQWDVELAVGTTSPACLMYIYFEREIRASLMSREWVRSIRIEWHHGVARIEKCDRWFNSDQVQLSDVDGWYRYSVGS